MPITFEEVVARQAATIRTEHYVLAYINEYDHLELVQNSESTVQREVELELQHRKELKHAFPGEHVVRITPMVG